MKSDDKSNHTKRAAADLRQWIISGEVAGGSRLREIAVAEKLNISRTPVREAMARLAEEGLLERVGTGGFVVRAGSRQFDASLKSKLDSLKLALKSA